MACQPDRGNDGAAGDPLAAARTVLRQAALPCPATIVVGVSGGGDSLALALVLARLAPELKLRVVAAHYDHGVRDAASCAAERATVRRQAQCLGLQLREGSAPAGELRRRRLVTGRSLEEIARVQRYAFLLRVAAEHGACAVAVGHHRDDDLETILMRALQGSLRGGGIPRRNGLVLRPLLGVRREVLRRYVATAGLPVMEDPSNADVRMLRNRIRRLLPALEAAVPGSADNLPLLAAGNRFLLAPRATGGAPGDPVALCPRRVRRGALPRGRGDLLGRRRAGTRGCAVPGVRRRSQPRAQRPSRTAAAATALSAAAAAGSHGGPQPVPGRSRAAHFLRPGAGAGVPPRQPPVSAVARPENAATRPRRGTGGNTGPVVAHPLSRYLRADWVGPLPARSAECPEGGA